MKIRLELPWHDDVVLDINEDTGVCSFVLPPVPSGYNKLTQDIKDGYVQSLRLKPSGTLPETIVKERRRDSLAKAQELHKKASAEEIVKAAQMYYDYLDQEG